MSLQSRLNELYQFCKSNVPQFNMAPGTVLNDLLSAVAALISNFEASFEGGITNAFVSTAVGSALDALALDRALTRTGANPATGSVIFTRADASGNLNLPAGLIVTTNNLDPTTNVTFVTLTPISFAPGVASASVNAVCTTNGTLGNIGVGTISGVVSTAVGITSVTNPSNMTGGADAETDTALRIRIFQSMTPQNSVQRINSAVLGVTGVFSSATFDQQDGLGNFLVYACAPGGTLGTTLKTNVQSAADSNKSLGTVGTIYSPTVTTVNVSYNFAPQTNFTAASVQAAINAAITAYFSSLTLGQTIRPYDIVSRVIGNVQGFSAVNGVKDFQLTSPSAFQTALPWQLFILGTFTVTQISD